MYVCKPGRSLFSSESLTLQHDSEILKCASVAVGHQPQYQQGVGSSHKTVLHRLPVSDDQPSESARSTAAPLGSARLTVAYKTRASEAEAMDLLSRQELRQFQRSSCSYAAILSGLHCGRALVTKHSCG
jgi:hypothetical protein